MKTISLIGPTKTRWGQTFSFKTVHVVLELPVNDNIAETGHTIVEQIRSSIEVSRPKTIQDTIAFCSFLNLPPGGSMIIAIEHKGMLFIAGVGVGTVFIYRNKEWGQIYSGKPVSGPILENDLLFLCSESINNLFSEQDLMNSARSEDMFTIEEQLAEKLHKQSDADGEACLILKKSSGYPPFTLQDQKNANSDIKLNTKDSFTAGNTINTKQKITAGVGVLISILLIISLIVGSGQRAKIERKDQLEQVLGAVSSSIEEGSALVQINPKAARDLLLPIQEQLAKSLDIFPENSAEYQQVVDLIAKTSELIEKSQRKFEIEKPDLFIDLSWISDTAQASKMYQSDDTLITLDQINGSAYKTTLEKKNNDIIVSDPTLKNAVDVAFLNNHAFFITNQDQNRLYNDEKKTITKSFGENDNPIALFAYGGNLYILDTNLGIMKMPKTDEGFGSPRSYLADDIVIDLEDSKDMAIDGSIWVLTNDNILKFTLGAPDAFFIKNEVLASAKALYTDEESKFLYILEDTRIVVIDKEGNYEEQYIWDGFKNTADISVINDKTILFLQSQKVYQIVRP